MVGNDESQKGIAEKEQRLLMLQQVFPALFGLGAVPNNIRDFFVKADSIDKIRAQEDDIFALNAISIKHHLFKDARLRYFINPRDGCWNLEIVFLSLKDKSVKVVFKGNFTEKEAEESHHLRLTLGGEEGVNLFRHSLQEEWYASVGVRDEVGLYKKINHTKLINMKSSMLKNLLNGPHAAQKFSIRAIHEKKPGLINFVCRGLAEKNTHLTFPLVVKPMPRVIL